MRMRVNMRVLLILLLVLITLMACSSAVEALPAELPEPAAIEDGCPLPPGWLAYEAVAMEYQSRSEAWLVRFSNGKTMLVREIEGPDIIPGDPVIVMVDPEGEFFKAYLNAQR